ncbi:MAG: ribonuclease III [Rhodospirillales bacterium]|nr:ribonuclease III [Rhodospirillales bacterium]
MVAKKFRTGSKRATRAKPAEDSLEQRIGRRFRDPGLLRLALTHSGAAGGLESNERLEFLGDRVLGLIVADMLYERFPDEMEASLARRFVAAVRRETLTEIAESLQLERGLKLAREDSEARSRGRAGMLANACEALIGAIFLDGGLKAAEAFVTPRWRSRLDDAEPPPKDAKTALQEWAQARALPLPHYRETGRSGPAHAPRFEIEVAVKGHPPSRGEGPSKRAAAQTAAANLLAVLEAGPRACARVTPVGVPSHDAHDNSHE